MFKATIVKCPRVLLQLVNDILKEEFDYDKDDIKILNNQIGIDSIYEKKLTCDFVMLINDSYLINIEVNKGNYQGLYARNFVYQTKLFSSLFMKGMTYKEFSKYRVAQINFNLFHQENIGVTEEQMLYNVASKTVASDIIRIIQIDIEKCYELVYTKGIEGIQKIIRWGALFNETTMHGISEILGEDMLKMEDKKDLLNKIDRAKEREEILSKVTMEGDYEAIVGSYLEMGLEQGIIQGINQGIEQNKVEMIKSMLENNIDYEVISKVTGKTIEEIKEIENK